MSTSGRPEFVKKSTQCYLRQTYKNKELIVLSQGRAKENKKIRDYLQSLQREDILFVKAPKDLCLGAMRNATVELSTGEVICQWDDDDLYHSNRLLSQYVALRSNASAASLYSEFLKYFKTSQELYWCDWFNEHEPSHRYLCGSIMFYKKYFYEMQNMLYPEFGPQSETEEDLKVLERLMVKGDIIPVKEGHHYIYVYHGENTYDHEHHLLTIDTTWEKTIMSQENLYSHKTILCETLDEVGVDDVVKIRSEEGLSFTYHPKR